MMIHIQLLLLIMVLVCSRSSVFAQDTATIGLVEVYGARTISQSRVRKALGVEAGHQIEIDSNTIVTLRKRLTDIPGVKRSDIGLVCCWGNDGQWLLFAGVSEQSKDPFYYNPKPTGPERLPKEIMEDAQKFDSVSFEAVKQNDAGEDDSKGYALMDNAPSRHFQEKFIVYANSGNLAPVLKKVLHSSSSDDDRAVAAQVIAYSDNKKDIMADLIQAVHDPNGEVRNNSTRALGILATYANANPGLGLKVPGSTFVQMLNSLVWTDRNKALFVLMPLTQHRDPALLSHLKKEALPSLTEMARWKDPGHTYPAYIILGRIAGFPEEKIGEAFSSPSKDEWLEKIIRTIH